MMFGRLARVAGAALILAIVAPAALRVADTPARAQLQPPAGRLFGFVQVHDHGASNGTAVVAYVNSSACGQASYDANRGLYILDLDSSISDCDQMDATVWFTVGPCTAYTTGAVPEYSGALRFDLVAPGSC